VFTTVFVTPSLSQVNLVNLDDNKEDKKVLDKRDNKRQSLTVKRASSTVGSTGSILT